MFKAWHVSLKCESILAHSLMPFSDERVRKLKEKTEISLSQALLVPEAVPCAPSVCRVCPAPNRLGVLRGLARSRRRWRSACTTMLPLSRDFEMTERSGSLLNDIGEQRAEGTKLYEQMCRLDYGM